MPRYNLLDPKSIDLAIKNSVPCLNGRSVSSVETSMQQFHNLGTNSQFFNFDKKGECEVSGKDWSEVIAVESMIKVGELLNQLSSFSNFNSFATAFNNPQQFSATMFEVDCCSFFIRDYKFTSFEFDPEHLVKGHTKRPEFKAVFDGNIEVFGECKSLASLNGLRSSRVMKIKSPIFQKILPIVPDNRRIEVSFKMLPQNWNRNYADQIFGAAGQLIKMDYMTKHLELVLDQKHTTWIKLCDRSHQKYLTNIVNVADVPPDQSPKIILGELANIKGDIKELIKDARSQLSDDSFSVIFIYSLHKVFAKQAIAEFFQDNKLKKLTGIFSWTDILEFHKNPYAELDLDTLKR